LHFTVEANPATLGDDDHEQVLALWTVTGHLTVPPSAVTWRVGTVAVPAALASEGTAKAARATVVTRERRTVRMSDFLGSLLRQDYAFHRELLPLPAPWFGDLVASRAIRPASRGEKAVVPAAPARADRGSREPLVAEIAAGAQSLWKRDAAGHRSSFSSSRLSATRARKERTVDWATRCNKARSS
jgi:hypothetical protein